MCARDLEISESAAGVRKPREGRSLYRPSSKVKTKISKSGIIPNAEHGLPTCFVSLFEIMWSEKIFNLSSQPGVKIRKPVNWLFPDFQLTAIHCN